MNIHDQAEFIRIRGQLPLVFTPAAPVTRGELFAGRTEQVQRVLDAVSSPGQHAIIFGERGVGKTSLASMIHYFWSAAFQDSEIIAPWITCDTTDSFGTVWAKVLEAILDNYELPNVTDADPDSTIAAVMEEIGAGAATPDLVRRFFMLAGCPFAVTIDEFDRVGEDEARILLADTVKTLADHRSSSTLVLVGVADTVTELITDHASIGRNLTQVLMPRMSPDELKDIVRRGLETVGMSIEPQALAAVAVLSQGLPHYTHLLALNAAIRAIETREARTVEIADLTAALDTSIANAHHSIVASYHAATVSSKPTALFKEVLLACALCPTDELGYFAPRDVAAPLTAVVGKPYEIPTFVQHLLAFCQEDRAAVLQSTGSKYRRRYRFTDPILKPYIVLRGLKEHMVDASYVLNGA